MTSKYRYNDWVRKSFYESFERDFGLQFIKRHRTLLWIYNKTKLKVIGRLLCWLEQQDFKIVFTRKINRLNYQPTLDAHYNEIKRIWHKTLLPPLIHLNSISDISGFDLFNAESIPWFGETHISINSGVCYHSHTLTRCLQPYFIHMETGNRLPFFFYRYFQKKFRDSSIAYICQDHTYAFMKMTLIPEDDNLLFGIEQFIIAHELGHLMLQKYGYDGIGFGNYYNSETVDLIKNNEEIAADGFAIITLSNITQLISKSIYTLYGPRFLFKILSLYENSNLLNKPVNHPSCNDRYSYLVNMINQMGIKESHTKFDNIIDSLWVKTGDEISKKCAKIRKFQLKYIAIVEDIFRNHCSSN